MANRVPADFLDRLLGRIDIVEVIGARVPLKKSGHEWSACCPFHNEKTPSFFVSPNKQFYHCFGCGAHGSAIGFLMDYEHLEFLDAVEDLVRAAGMQMPDTGRPAGPVAPDLHPVLEEAHHHFRRQLDGPAGRERALAYLHRRGLDDAVIEAYGIGYAPPGWHHLGKALGARGIPVSRLVEAGLLVRKDNGEPYDRFRDRIVFPIRDHRGRPIAFGGRALDDGTPKYLNSPETALFHKGRELYGLHEARRAAARAERLVVVEGYMDVIALAQHGVGGCVATLGTSTTAEHMQRLFRVTRDLVFCFDGDAAGRRAAWRALETALPSMSEGRQVGFVFLPEGEDPDSLVRQEGAQGFLRRIERATPLSEHLFEHLAAGVDLGSVDGRARLVEDARPLLGRLPDGPYRELMAGRLARAAGVGSIEVGPAPVLRRPPPAKPASLVGRAVAILLLRPDLARGLDSVAFLRESNERGAALLLELIEMLRSCPHLDTTAQVLERYRGAPGAKALERLAGWRPEIPEALLDAELKGTLARLEQRNSADRRFLQRLIRSGDAGQAGTQALDESRNLARGQRVKG